MDYYLERLESELKRILNFWTKHLVSEEKSIIYPECFNDGSTNPDADLGSLYLGRIIYGASAASRFLNTNEYKFLADIAFKQLYENLKNEKGGYYWAVDKAGNPVHNEHVNMALANVFYGLCEYALLTNSPVVNAEIKKLYSFLQNKVADKTNGGFLDGFDLDWNLSQNPERMLGTHMALLVAFSKHYEYTGSIESKNTIKSLINILIERFIDSENNIIYNRLKSDWSTTQNDYDVGASTQIGWILTSVANQIEEPDLYIESCKICLSHTDIALNHGFDREYGGVYSALSNNMPTNTNKMWWPQAETAIAAMQSYQFSKEKKYLSYAIRLIEYIENTISDNSNGEWFKYVSREGIPDSAVPKIDLWKALYHNVRYCIEMSNRLRSLISIP